VPAAFHAFTIMYGHLPDDRSLPVGFRLTPQDNTFYDLFATSAGHLVTGSRELTALLSVPVEERETSANRMRDHEHAADEATHAIMRRVNSSFITPFDREDIYALASNLDDCMDHMEAAVDLIVLYRIGELPSGIAAQVEVLSRMSELTAQAMPHLRSMRDLSEYWIEINRLENQADELLRQGLIELFHSPHEPLEVLTWSRIYEMMEEVTDKSEDIADVLRGLVIKNA